MRAQTPALHSLSTTGLLFYNALLSLPLLLASLLASPESAGIRAFPGLWSPGLLVCCPSQSLPPHVSPPQSRATSSCSGAKFAYSWGL